MELNLLRKPLLVATVLIGLKTGVMGQTTEAQNQVDQFSAVSHGSTTDNFRNVED